MKQEPEHYGFPRTHYNNNRTEFYPRRGNTVSKISPKNENIENPDCMEIVLIKENPTENLKLETRNKTAKKKQLQTIHLYHWR